MAQYYALKKVNNSTELLEVCEAKNLSEARKVLCKKYMSIILSMEAQLVIVGKAGYEQYYK